MVFMEGQLWKASEAKARPPSAQEAKPRHGASPGATPGAPDPTPEAGLTQRPSGPPHPRPSPRAARPRPLALPGPAPAPGAPPTQGSQVSAGPPGGGPGQKPRVGRCQPGWTLHVVRAALGALVHVVPSSLHTCPTYSWKWEMAWLRTPLITKVWPACNPGLGFLVAAQPHADGPVHSSRPHPRPHTFPGTPAGPQSAQPTSSPLSRKGAGGWTLVSREPDRSG